MRILPAPTRAAGLTLLLLPLAASHVGAQEEAAGGGETAAVGAGVYTEAQAERGERVFAESCAQCHVEGRFRGASFLPSWDGAPVSVLYTVIRSQMPFDNPGSLEPGEYADVIAYIFRLNGFPAGEDPLPSEPEALRAIRIDAPSARSDSGDGGGARRDGEGRSGRP